MPVTLKDVARHSNVSIKTVSRVVNNQGEISPETRLRVQSAIDELGYRPNILARSLVNRRSNTIAVVAAGIEYFGPSRTLLGIEQQADEFGYSLSLNLLPNGSESNVQPVLDELVARQVDGIVWSVPEIGDNHQWVNAAALAELPPMVFLTLEPRPGPASIAVDNREGAQLAVEHLLAQGRRQIGIITGPLSWWEARERLAGWQATLDAAGLETGPEMMVEGDWSPASGERGMEQLLANGAPLDALFACNDQMALGALGVLHRAGIAVPREIAVVGFDNIPEAAFFIPPLTTIYQQVTEIGRAAVRELHEEIQARRSGQERSATSTRLSPTLIVRASSLS